MNRSLLAAPIAALALCGVLAGTALAQEDARACEVVRSELAAAEVAATLPVTIGGQSLTTLPQVQTFYDLAKDQPALAETAAALKAVLDAAAKVDLLKQETTTCVETPDPTVDPTPTPDPTTEPPATTVAPPVTSTPSTSGTASVDGDVADSVPQGSVDTGGW